VRGGLQALAAAAEEMGGEVPPEIEDSFVFESGMPYWDGFHTLSRSRGYTSGLTLLPLPLAYSEITEYCRDHFLAGTPDTLQESVEIIQAMDKVYLDFQQARAAEKVKQSPKKR
jgi:hypothetical protein